MVSPWYNFSEYDKLQNLKVNAMNEFTVPIKKRFELMSCQPQLIAKISGKTTKYFFSQFSFYENKNYVFLW